MNSFAERLKDHLGTDALEHRLVGIMIRPTGTTSAGYPFLERDAWQVFRDTIPHILQMGLHTLHASRRVAAAARELGDGADVENVERAARVIRQVVFTATITAPTDLWLLRHVLGTWADLGLLQRLREGQAIYPEDCRVDGRLDPNELETDLHFLLARGIVEQYDDSFRLAGHPTVRDIASRIAPVPDDIPAGVSRLWRRAFSDLRLGDDERTILASLGDNVPRRTSTEQTHWVATLDEIELGYRLVPLVLGLSAAGITERLLASSFAPSDLHPAEPSVATAACSILEAAAWVEQQGDAFVLTDTGRRGMERGPGPFGIIEAYHPYMEQLGAIARGDRGDVWVRRSENVGASQDANKTTFERANDALDRYCADTGFEYSVFIEHAIGRGEATRQRYARSGDDSIRYFGADLEDDAIDAAEEEQRKGRLPAGMVFVRNADIGKPAVLLDAIREAGADPRGAVMLVGNGFHEVRDQSDKRMVEVFRQYHDAGVILVFTEENALSVDDLRSTAFNTYHAGFKYVHEKSGQGLRPAHPRPKPRLGKPLRAPWSECARRAGYTRLDEYCSRTRTIYPHTPRDGHNPSISVSHFVIPQ